MPTDTFDDLQAQARKSWEAWSESLRDAAADTSQADWPQALQWWSRLLPQAAPQSPLGDVLDKFNAQAGDLYAKMQQVAAHFAGREAGPEEIAAKWRETLGAGSGRNPFGGIFGAQAPMSGFARQYRDRWQELEKLLRECREHNDHYEALIAQATQRAFEEFENRLGAHAANGEQIESARALFDTWIDAAEEAYARIALSADFGRALGGLSKAQLRLRAALQKEVEQASELFGLPTRTEVDAAHRRIAELERALRKLQRGSGRQESKPVKKAVRKAVKKSAKKTAAKRLAKKRGGR